MLKKKCIENLASTRICHIRKGIEHTQEEVGVKFVCADGSFLIDAKSRDRVIGSRRYHRRRLIRSHGLEDFFRSHAWYDCT